MKKLFFFSLLSVAGGLCSYYFFSRPSIPGTYLQKEANQAFSVIYENGHWSPKGTKWSEYEKASGDSASGLGSIPENTIAYRGFLENFLKEKNIKSVVDYGCGDWEFSRLIDWNGIKYTGIDIVSRVIKRNKLLFSKKNIKFLKASKLKQLPKADLLICKDVLQHWPIEQIQDFLPELKKYRYCLITNSVDPLTHTSDNLDIQTGAYRFLDLEKAPFNIKGETVLLYPTSDPQDVKKVLWITN